MLDKTKSIGQEIRKLEEIEDRVEYLWGKYHNEDCFILAAGPSLKKYPVEYIKDKLKDKVVICIKQSIKDFYDITDFHCLNFTNYEPYNELGAEVLNARANIVYKNKILADKFKHMEIDRQLEKTDEVSQDNIFPESKANKFIEFAQQDVIKKFHEQNSKSQNIFYSIYYM